MTEKEFKEVKPPRPRIPKPHLVNGIPISFPTAEAEFEDTPASDPINDVIQEKMKESTPPTPPAPQPKPVAKRKAAQPPAPVAPAPVVEEPVKEPEPPIPHAPKPVKQLTGNNAIAMFKQAVGAGMIPVELYSTGEEVLMRELTVTDQKTLSKTALINSNRRDIMYNAQNSLINSCVKTEGFDVRNQVEFDRIVILLRLYQQNYFSNDIHYTCPKCGKENVYKLDFGKVLDRVKGAWRTDKTYDHH